MNEQKKAVNKYINEISEELAELAIKMKENPEIGFKEYKAAEWLTEELKKHGFEVEYKTGNLETAFKGAYSKGSKKPKIAFLCEYDALPGIGHGCGHNLIAPASIGAAIALSKLDDFPAEIDVFGCPGEENGGGKVVLVNEGEFKDIDIAMMVHPSTENRVYSTSLALDAIEFTFTGKTSHASGAPELGINALDAAILFYNGISAIRQHVKDDVRIHGIITEGGKAANVVPDKAVTNFYFRAKERKYLDEVVQKAYNIALGAASMTGAKVTWKNYELSNDNLQPNKTLAQIFKENYELIGIKDVKPGIEGGGSTDMGNVSQVVPAVHPYVAIGDKGDFNPHSVELAEATVSKRGLEGMINAARALAFTAIDVAFDPEKLNAIKEEFNNQHK